MTDWLARLSWYEAESLKFLVGLTFLLLCVLVQVTVWIVRWLRR